MDNPMERRNFPETTIGPAKRECLEIPRGGNLLQNHSPKDSENLAKIPPQSDKRRTPQEMFSTSNKALARLGCGFKADQLFCAHIPFWNCMRTSILVVPSVHVCWFYAHTCSTNLFPAKFPCLWQIFLLPDFITVGGNSCFWNSLLSSLYQFSSVLYPRYLLSFTHGLYKAFYDLCICFWSTFVRHFSFQFIWDFC